MTAAALDVPEYISKLADEHPHLQTLDGSPVVVISSVFFKGLKKGSYEAIRFQVSLAVSRYYTDCGIAQIVMVDPQSDNVVAEQFRKAGAYVVITPRSGLARPYIDAAWLVRVFAQAAIVLKAEADKRVDEATVQMILHTEFDVLVLQRSEVSMKSMHPVQERTERVIDETIPKIVPGVPAGASCGVQAYGPRALHFLLNFDVEKYGDTWVYLLVIPWMATQKPPYVVIDREFDLMYNSDMVAAEATPALYFKRLMQLLVMLEGAWMIAGMGDLSAERFEATKEAFAELNGAIAEALAAKAA